MKQSKKKKKNEIGVYRFVHIPGTTQSGIENMIRVQSLIASSILA